MKREITLCLRCLADYRNAGYIVKRDYQNQIKSPCEICSRDGLDYYFYEKKERREKHANETLC